MVDQFKQLTQLRFQGVYRFKPKIRFELEVPQYLIKTAETKEELLECFKLRHAVFFEEFQESNKSGLDFDRFDYYFDHLIIVHKESKRIIGTYRLSCSTFSSESYTALEFDLSLLKLQKGPTLELGRACIQKEYRKGSVISLLWRGIAEYMNLSDSSLLFGCSSLKINDASKAALVFRYLELQKKVNLEFLCKPQKEFRFENFDSWYALYSKNFTQEDTSTAESLIPPLVKSYLKLGASIACEPAFDSDFDCIDLLTVLRKENLANALAERYQVVR